MTNNDVLRSLQQVLGVNEATLTDIFKLSRHPIEQSTVASFLKDASDTAYAECNDSVLTLFLDGLITYRRGSSPQNPPDTRKTIPPLTNNSIFKKLRIAFDLKEEDLLELMSLANYEVSKNELSAIFRKPGHKHYRSCSDDFLMGFLVGLTYRQWK